MRTLRSLIGLFSIFASGLLFIMFLAVYVLFFAAIWGGDAGTLPYTVTPAYFLMPPFLFVAGIIGIAGRANKVAAIVGGILFGVAGAVGLYFGATPVADAPTTALGIVYAIIAAFFILGGIFQKGMRLKTSYEKKLIRQHEAAQLQASRQPLQPLAPNAVPGWTCSCGTVNVIDAKFCKNCGKAKPAV